MTSAARSRRDTIFLSGAVLGPGFFFVSWVIGGLLYPGSTLERTHISTLAAIGAPSRLIMVVGQVAMAAGLALAALPARSVLGLGASAGMGLAAVSLAVIIVTPDGSVPELGLLHGGFAILLYAALVAIGGLAGRHLRNQGRQVAGIVALGAATATGIFLWLSLGDTASGLFQRLGITATSAWLIAVVVRSGKAA